MLSRTKEKRPAVLTSFRWGQARPQIEFESFQVWPAGREAPLDALGRAPAALHQSAWKYIVCDLPKQSAGATVVLSVCFVRNQKGAGKLMLPGTQKNSAGSQGRRRQFVLSSAHAVRGPKKSNGVGEKRQGRHAARGAGRLLRVFGSGLDMLVGLVL